ncbi:MAG: hypothetical protein OXU27_12610 [Candidatus Poribacteria bacterium]|nr:hypothetical protein [Candidatus Poribacteria bacterium]MDE0326954.1 hypothetical protein [Candidatus Poribacteria bacterium]
MSLKFETEDLIKIEIPTDKHPQPQSDFSLRNVHNVEVNVIFRDHKTRLLECIADADFVVGCVAWLTDYDILDALAEKSGVSIIVQKEDFLRPDGDVSKKTLRKKYDQLPQIGGRVVVGGLISSLSTLGDPKIQSVRCVGNHNRDRNPSFSRMHNKFLIFMNYLSEDELNNYALQKTFEFMKDKNIQIFDGEVFEVFRRAITVIPSENSFVWTGSYNLSYNATKSFENSVILRHLDIVQAYWKEWQQITALSEPLNWDSVWCEPEWRIGT